MYTVMQTSRVGDPEAHRRMRVTVSRMGVADGDRSSPGSARSIPHRPHLVEYKVTGLAPTLGGLLQSHR